MRVLLAEDDTRLADSIILAIRGSGYTVDWVGTGSEVSGALLDTQYDLLLLDLGLPDIDGINLLMELRQRGIALPVIIVTARDSVPEKVRGLELGANDYITKPFDFRELHARMKTLLRSNVWSNKLEISVGPVRFDTNTREVLFNERVIPLTPKEVAAFELLLKSVGRLVTKEDLIDKLKDWDKELSENGVETIIHRLRRKLTPAKLEIKTVRGFGYTLEKPNEPVHS